MTREAFASLLCALPRALISKLSTLCAWESFNNPVKYIKYIPVRFVSNSAAPARISSHKTRSKSQTPTLQCPVPNLLPRGPLSSYSPVTSVWTPDQSTDIIPNPHFPPVLPKPSVQPNLLPTPPPRRRYWPCPPITAHLAQVIDPTNGPLLPRRWPSPESRRIWYGGMRISRYTGCVRPLLQRRHDHDFPSPCLCHYAQHLRRGKNC